MSLLASPAKSGEKRIFWPVLKESGGFPTKNLLHAKAAAQVTCDDDRGLTDTITDVFWLFRSYFTFYDGFYVRPKEIKVSNYVQNSFLRRRQHWVKERGAAFGLSVRGSPGFRTRHDTETTYLHPGGIAKTCSYHKFRKANREMCKWKLLSDFVETAPLVFVTFHPSFCIANCNGGVAPSLSLSLSRKRRGCCQNVISGARHPPSAAMSHP